MLEKLVGEGADAVLRAPGPVSLVLNNASNRWPAGRVGWAFGEADYVENK